MASKEVKKVEDIVGRKAAVLMFSPDHTVLEFMLTNSRLTPEEVAQVRKATSFSMDDFTYARILFGKGQVDVACLWEPDVTLALASRPGAHRLFSTADATELVADTLVAKREFLDLYPELAVKLARVWFAGVKKAESDRPAAAKLVATVCSRFRDELGYEATLKAFDWVKWTGLGDNVRMFGLDGQPPAFDRVYNQADGIWINYPQAEIKDRFVARHAARRPHRPPHLGGRGEARRHQGREVQAGDRRHRQAAVHQAGHHRLSQRQERPRRGEAMAVLNKNVVPAGADGGRHVRPRRGQHRQPGRRDLEPGPERAPGAGDRRLPGHAAASIAAAWWRAATARATRSPATRPPRAAPATAAPTSCSSPPRERS